MMKYKGYTAKISIDEQQNAFHGEVLGLTDVVTFEGTTFDELRAAFHESVDDYLEFCESRGESPEKPYSGRFVVRMSPELHRACALAAEATDQSLNSWVNSALKKAAEARVQAPAAGP